MATTAPKSLSVKLEEAVGEIIHLEHEKVVLRSLLESCPMDYTASGPVHGYATVNGDDGKKWLKQLAAHGIKVKGDKRR